MHDAPFHLDPEELDLWLDGRLAETRTSHIETCEQCRAAAEEIRELVQQLEALPKVAPASAFADRVMARVSVAAAVEHLTAEDLDQWVLGALPAGREAHLGACPECQKLADEERILVLRLQALPLFSPPPGFERRVMARVNVPIRSLAGAWRHWRNRVFEDPRTVAAAAGVAVMLGGSLAASAAWAAAHQDAISGVVPWLWSQGQQLFWQGVSMASNAVQSQPWYPPVRDALTPGRIAALAGVGTGLYAAGLLALRRLLALPSGQAARALP
jgi:hypothetical protein